MIELLEAYPAISLWQPWASLCFADDADLRKLDETRHWPCPATIIGSRIAIHAAKRFPSQLDEGLIRLCEAAFGVELWRDLPTGALLGTVTVDACRRTADVRGDTTPANLIAGNFEDATMVRGVARQRYAWRLSNPVRLAEPVPMKGRQGWFTVVRGNSDQVPQ
jgi:hypothetical protein